MTEQRWTAGTHGPGAGETGDAGGGSAPGEPPPGGAPPGGPPPGGPPPGEGTPPGAPPPGASGGAAVPPLRVLRRSRDDRVIAGVAGGLGRWARVDPVLFRVGFAVLTVFGGAGLLLYAIGWLLVPEEDAAGSEGQRLTSGRSPGVVSVVLATVAGLILVGIVLDGNVGGVAALLVIGALVALAAARRDQGGSPSAPPPYPPPGYGPQGYGPQGYGPTGYGPQGSGAPGYPAPPPSPTPPPGGPGWGTPPTGAPAGPEPGGPAAATPGAADPTVPSAAAVTGPTGPATSTAPTAPHATPHATAPYGAGAYGPPPPAPAPWTAPPPPPEPRERSGLTALTLSLAALVTGVLLALDVADVSDVPARVVVAAPLAVTALGLLVGAWFGRGRGLIGAGAVLTLVLTVTVATPDVPFEAGAGQRQWVPVVADDATADPYRLGAGEATLDLTRLEPAGRTLDVDARVGMGKLVVLVPEDVDLRADAEVTAGEIDMPDDVRTDGLSVERTYEEEAAVDPAEGTVDLDVRVGFGQLEVRRAAS